MAFLLSSWICIQLMIESIFRLITIVDSQICTLSSISLSTNEYAHSSAYDIINNALYLFGGLGANRRRILKWDINNNIWDTLSVGIPSIANNYFYVWSNSVATINNIAYFVGVDDELNYESGNVYRFDFASEQWLDHKAISSPQNAAIHSCMTHNNSHIFIVGGQTANSYIDQLQIYEISTNLWVSATINITPIENTGWILGYCHSISADLYVFGGAATEYGQFYDIMLKYDAMTSTKWTSIGSLPTKIAYGYAIYHETSNIIYLLGGIHNWWSPMDSIYVFDVNTESISKTLTITMTQAKAAFSVNMIHNTLYIFGGQNNAGSSLSDIETCTIPEKTVTPTTLEPTSVPTKPSVSLTNSPTSSTDPTISPFYSTTLMASTAILTTSKPSISISSTLEAIARTIEVSTVEPTTTIVASIDLTGALLSETMESEVIETTSSNDEVEIKKEKKWLIYTIICVAVFVFCFYGVSVIIYRSRKKVRSGQDIHAISRTVAECDDKGTKTSFQKELELQLQQRHHGITRMCTDNKIELDAIEKVANAVLQQNGNINRAEGVTIGTDINTNMNNMESDDFEVIGDEETRGQQAYDENAIQHKHVGSDDTVTRYI